ncbi:Unknown protein sequence, partial [Pseudomonas cannabina pv. alisalensis]
ASPGSVSGLSRHLRRTLRRQCHCDKKALSFNYRATLRVGMPCLLDALRPLCGAPRHIGVLRGQLDMFPAQVTFSPLGDLL